MLTRRLLALISLLIALGATTGIVVAEAGARLLEWRSCRMLTGGWDIRSRLYGWGNRPGATGFTQGCRGGAVEWRAYSAINSRGLRDREIPYEHGDAFRILVLGDSFTAGFQVAQDQAFPKLVERRLNAAGARVEVVNAGVSGWGTDQALLYYRTEGHKYDADLVLLAFDTTNDVFESQRRLVSTSVFWPDKPYFAFEDGRLVLRHFPLAAHPPLRVGLAEIASWLQRHSAAFRRTSNVPSVQAFWRLEPPETAPDALPGATPFQSYLTHYPEQWREAWRIVRGLILRLRQEVERDGAAFAVVVLNPREEVSPERWAVAKARFPQIRTAECDIDKPQRLISRFLARRGIPMIPTLDRFRAAFGETNALPGYYHWDIHYDVPGHELAARVVTERLLALGLVPAGDVAEPMPRGR